MERVAALGLDVGKRRVGVAGCDGTGLIARELTTIQRSSFVRDVEQLRAIVRERQVTVLVVGMPYTLRGEVGQQAERVRQFAER
ncbi:MAG: Holliday junction resolvase RuvX, partial [Cyanobacteria bacterium J06641_5]